MMCKCGCGSESNFGEWVRGHWMKKEWQDEEKSFKRKKNISKKMKGKKQTERHILNRSRSLKKFYQTEDGVAVAQRRADSLRKYSPSAKKAAIFMRNALHRCLSLCGTEKSDKTFDILGYSPDDLVECISSQFVDGMSWENYGHDTWHIDHIRPISSFPERSDPKDVNALSNLRPLWAEDNHAKNSKWQRRE